MTEKRIDSSKVKKIPEVEKADEECTLYTPNTWFGNAILHRAILFATKAHQGQTRKGTDIPYISHPFEVAQILTSAGCNTVLIIAGLLHDVLEDTDETSDAIENEFGPLVLSLIQSNSEDKSRSWEERKQHTIDYMTESASFEELLLACADKLSNLRSIKADYIECGDELWTRFNRGKEQQSWYYSRLIDAFAPLHEYDMYWEISNLYTDIFVTYYREFNEGAEIIYQTNGQETYFYHEDNCQWIPIMLDEWEKIQPTLTAISKREALEMENRLREDYPSPMCLLRHQRDPNMIVLYAKKLLREGHSPRLFADLWNNMGGGIPAHTLRAIECAFLALYEQKDQ
ncbi:HD domain-containing protein [Bacillus sp. D386]|uniref:HD domain-containing protein n=1 Tax=Bacillus sp. D386 TaxID=2587155 RepID=UPI0015D6458A|nr:HD domain-containing protein [Bacillus sp. D386]